MTQQSPGCDDPDLSVFKGSRRLEMVDGPRGPWSIRREPEWKSGGGEREEEEGEEDEAIESVENDTACSLWEQKTNKVREKQY